MQLLTKFGEDRMNTIWIRVRTKWRRWKCTNWPYDL